MAIIADACPDIERMIFKFNPEYFSNYLQVVIKLWNVYSTECPAKLFPLGYLLFCRLLLTKIAKVGMFLKNSGDLLHDRHKNFENRFRNS